MKRRFVAGKKVRGMCGKSLTLAVCSALTLSLCACESLSVDYESDVVLPANYDGFISGEKNDAELNEWWKLFNDDYLSELMDRALSKNTDLRTARMRYGRALYEARLGEADLGPAVSADGGIMGGRTDVRSPGRRMDSTDSQSAVLLGLQGSWEPDFFGEKQSKADAARYRALSARDGINAVSTSVTALLARRYFEILALKEKKKILRDNIANLRNLHRYAEGRFNAGQATSNDVAAVSERITSLEAEISVLDDAFASAVRTIAVLTGDSPQNFVMGRMPDRLPDVIPNPPAGAVPGDLLLRRPDILSKRNEINARAAMVASAKADLYPRFEISFLGQLGRIEMHSKPDIDGWAAFLTGSVSVPVFTNGRIRAEIETRNAEMKTALAEYDGLILKALKEVDDGYSGTVLLTRRLETLEKGRSGALGMTSEARKLFEYGRADFDAIVDARSLVLSYDEKINETALNRLYRLIDLYKSLGGGWNYSAEGSDAGHASGR